MKKFFIFLVLVLCLFSININYVVADDNNYKVITDFAYIVSTPNSSNVEKLEEVSKGIILSRCDDIVYNDESETHLTYYKISYNEIEGYILTNTVRKDENNFNVVFKPNAKINKESEVFILTNGEYSNFVYNGENIVLQTNTEIKLLNGFDKNKTYQEISFEKNNEILTGYVLTENISVSGFRYYVLIIIFVLIVVFTTVIPIVVKNWKKKRKLNQTIDRISTSPHKTSK